MADADQQVLIAAYVRYGTTDAAGQPAANRARVYAIWLQAFTDVNSGVTLTSVSFEGASSSGVQAQVDSAKLLAITQQALDVIDGTGHSRSTHGSFAFHRLET